MLRGIMVSGNNTFADAAGFDFVMIKASEGVGWKSDKLDLWIQHVCGSMNPNPAVRYALYHYPREETGNTAVKEADWFLECIGDHYKAAALALCFDDKVSKRTPEWAVDFLKRVYEKTGVAMVIGLNEDQFNNTHYVSIISRHSIWLTAPAGHTPNILPNLLGDGKGRLSLLSPWNSMAPYSTIVENSVETGENFDGQEGPWKILSQKGNTIVLTDGNLKIQLEAPHA